MDSVRWIMGLAIHKCAGIVSPATMIRWSFRVTDAVRVLDDPTMVKAKERIARMLRRAPWMAYTLVSVLRLTRAHYTAGVVGVVLNDAREVLLVEHVYHPGWPWGLPGGWIERGESPVQTLERELGEELGLQVNVLLPLVVDTEGGSGHIDIAYLCVTNSVVQHLCSELLSYRWTPMDNIPAMIPFHQKALECAKREVRGRGL